MIPEYIKVQPQKAKALYINITMAQHIFKVYGGCYEKQFNRKTLFTASGFYPRRNNDDAGDNQRIKT
jgi:hypothetical protein